MSIKQFILKKDGFTLWEILVVLAVLGLLAAIAVPNLLQLVSRGDRSVALEEEHTLVIAIASSKVGGATTIVPHVGIIVANHSAAINDPARYIDQNTRFQWIITDTGALTPGTNNPLLS